MKVLIYISIMGLTVMNAMSQSWVPVGTGLVENNKPRQLDLSITIVYDDKPEEHNGTINCLAVFQNELYAGGFFKYAGTKSVNNIAKWNGTEWSTVGMGIEGAVFSMCAYKEELYVSGKFNKIGSVEAMNIAKWNGKEWSSVGKGLDGGSTGMCIFKDELIVTGSISEAGGKKVKGIARWNGTKWSAMGEGVPNDIMAMEVYQNELYVGGTFIDLENNKPNLLKWNGTRWKGVASFDGAITGLMSDGQSLYATGFFSDVDGIYISRMTKYNGKAWTAVGNQGAYSTRSGDRVGSLLYNDGQLYASGRVWDEDTKKNGITGKWDGKKWVSFSTPLFGSVSVLAIYKNDLYAGGSFIISGDLNFSNIAKLQIK